VIITVIAIFVIVSVTVLPVFKINSDSMSPTFNKGDIVATLRSSDVKTGDVIAFYYNNKVLVKRVIAKSGDEVMLDWYGNLTVNGEKIDEPYISKKAFGEANVTFPYTVSAGKVFVMGDERTGSIDSRNTEIGCISQEQIIGKVVIQLWPFKKIAIIK
jgi:signal peptidase I